MKKPGVCGNIRMKVSGFLCLNKKNVTYQKFANEISLKNNNGVWKSSPKSHLRQRFGADIDVLCVLNSGIMWNIVISVLIWKANIWKERLRRGVCYVARGNPFCLFDANSWNQPMLTITNWAQKTYLKTNWTKMKSFHSRICTNKCQNVDHFVQASTVQDLRIDVD